MTGRFIVLEGIDGCGKTTQIQHLIEWLPNSGLMPKGAAVVCTRCLLYTSPSPRDKRQSRMPSSA